MSRLKEWRLAPFPTADLGRYGRGYASAAPGRALLADHPVGHTVGPGLGTVMWKRTDGHAAVARGGRE